MEYLLLSVAAMSVAAQELLKKQFGKKRSGGVFLFSAMISLAAMLFFVLINRDWNYRRELFLPSVCFALCYGASVLFSVLALRCGSLAKTGLILSCSSVLPALVGVFALDEPVTVPLVLGGVCLVAALMLIYFKRRREEKNGRGTGEPLRWWIYVFLAFLGTGGCSVVQNLEQRIYGAEGRELFMIVALGIASALLAVIALCLREERTRIGETFKSGWLRALLCGGANGLTNLLVLFLTHRVHASVMFPVISGGKLVLLLLYSVTVERERFSVLQWLGFALGIASVILLNL